MRRPIRPLESLSRRQRQLTPAPFARLLLNLVRDFCHTDRVAVLWCDPMSLYSRLVPAERLWTPARDARLYPGPHPIVAHPPCGPWGKYRSNCHHAREDGVIAMDLVHRWGGVVEHPVGSSLFAEHGTAAGMLLCVNQGDFGHYAIKPTLLYLVPRK